MDEALDMPQPDRWKRLQRLRQSVYEWDAAQWLRAQLEALGVS